MSNNPKETWLFERQRKISEVVTKERDLWNERVRARYHPETTQNTDVDTIAGELAPKAVPSSTTAPSRALTEVAAAINSASDAEGAVEADLFMNQTGGWSKRANGHEPSPQDQTVEMLQRAVELEVMGVPGVFMVNRKLPTLHEELFSGITPWENPPGADDPRLQGAGLPVGGRPEIFINGAPVATPTKPTQGDLYAATMRADNARQVRENNERLKAHANAFATYLATGERPPLNADGTDFYNPRWPEYRKRWLEKQQQNRQEAGQ